MQDLSHLQKKLFKVIIRISKIDEDDGRKAAQGVVKFFDDADVKYEFWSHGPIGTIHMEFTTMFSLKEGADKASERLARICANMVWHSIGDYREPLKVKVAPFCTFGPDTTIYVLDDGVYWCDFYDEELVSLMGEDEKAPPVVEPS